MIVNYRPNIYCNSYCQAFIDLDIYQIDVLMWYRSLKQICSVYLCNIGADMKQTSVH